MISWQAKLVNLILRLLRYKERGQVRWSRPVRHRQAFEPPWFFGALFRIDRCTIDDRRVITISPRKRKADRHVLFFHGGAYVSEITLWHWLFVGRLVRAAGCKCTLIEYPLSPENDHRKTLSHIETVFRELLNNHAGSLIFMGDSAGGGLTLALAMMLRDRQASPQPDKLVLISPWLDLTQRTSIPESLQRRDHILAPETLKAAAAQYAGPVALTHYRLSPIYGNFAGLGAMGIWMGSSEIFYPELPPLRTALEQAGVPYRIYIGEAMQHDYPILPIPEGQRALREIAQFINT